jgi:hypothetical protein
MNWFFRMANPNLNPNEQMLKNLESKLSTDIEDIQFQIRNIPNIETRLEKLLVNI